MKLVWHIMKKDLRAVWPLALGWLALIALRIPLLWYVLNRADERMIRYLMPVSGFAIFGDVMLILALVRSLVHEDALVGDKSFWITRPMTGGQLLMAKATSAILICIVAPLVMLIPTWLNFGFNGAEVVAALFKHLLLNGGLVIVAFLFAVLTRKAGSFWLALISTCVAVVIASIVSSSAEIVIFADHLLRTRLWLAGISASVCVLIGIVYQFRTRGKIGAIGCFVAGATAFLLFVCFWPTQIAFFERLMNQGASMAEPAKVEWRGGKIQLVTVKPSSSLPDLIDAELLVTVPKGYGRIGFSLVQGQWKYGQSANDSAEMVRYDRRTGISTLTTSIGLPKENPEGSFSCILPLRFNANWLWNKDQPWEQVAFTGQFRIDLYQTVAKVELELLKNAKTWQGSYMTRVLRVLPENGAVVVGFLQAESPGKEVGEAFRLVDGKGQTVAFNADYQSYTTTWLLGITIKQYRLKFGEAKYRRPGSNDAAEVRAKALIGQVADGMTQEDLAALGWRFTTKVNQHMGYCLTDAKTEKLNIVKGAAP